MQLSDTGHLGTCTGPQDTALDRFLCVALSTCTLLVLHLPSGPPFGCPSPSLRDPTGPPTFPSSFGCLRGTSPYGVTPGSTLRRTLLFSCPTASLLRRVVLVPREGYLRRSGVGETTTVSFSHDGCLCGVFTLSPYAPPGKHTVVVPTSGLLPRSSGCPVVLGTSPGRGVRCPGGVDLWTHRPRGESLPRNFIDSTGDGRTTNVPPSSNKPSTTGVRVLGVSSFRTFRR